MSIHNYWKHLKTVELEEKEMKREMSMKKSKNAKNDLFNSIKDVDE